MLWAYRTTPYSATGETPYFLAFKAQVVVPIEVSLPSHQIAHFSHMQSDDKMRVKLDLLKETLEMANLWAATYKQCSARYYNSHVKQRAFMVRDPVLRKVMLNTKEANMGMLGPTWEDLYQMIKVL